MAAAESCFMGQNRFSRTPDIVLILGGFFFAAAVLGLLGWAVTSYASAAEAYVDTPFRSALRRLQSPMWTSLFLSVTKLGSTVYLTAVGCAAGVIFVYFRWWRALGLFVVAMVGQAILHNGFKLLVARPRPPANINYPPADGFSFPSGHALSALCLFASIAWLVTNRLENPATKAIIWIGTIVIVLLIGLSRSYIGIHHATDVLAGWLAAAIWTTAVLSADREGL